MSIDWVFYLLPALLVGTSISELAAHGEKSRITKLDPDYAQRLFRGLGERLFSRGGLCRRTVLYFQPPPAGLEERIRKLRLAHLFSDGLACAYLALFAILVLKEANA